MLFTRIKQAARLLLVAAVLLLFSQVTDADLLDREVVSANVVRATTLDFSNLDTANETSKSLFFSVQGMIPSGFQVETVRIKNEGELAVAYQLSATQTAGDGALCSALQLKVLSDWQTEYSGTLTGLSYETTVLEGQKSDLIFALSLDDTTASLSNNTCAFNIRVASLTTINGEDIQFTDEEVLQNQVSTGTWSTGV
ncbi:MAG: hypothetical protein A2632_02230 [Candidatus Pacebacteria bacterium RIFCSPHIGHO2_01_FULL_46_16]|nr:MAG: hypothetical protein A2632_02230 [Candidatus Pacebacteria bacterium RIFCSPHIGHO2_01_FULL_46_16]OGJ21209.1 MAG: hypothetical protein A3J60_00105 [Candidatus Pacebacteria bacterium RIFCSPHIGHO2_02_FULL_46_9]OGJ38204.1 MAG: hypothetical protein A3A82_01190 [Candidatus Pacebacteria bacterium RIFCSPLOWO2_01_FULL_47_12]